MDCRGDPASVKNEIDLEFNAVGVRASAPPATRRSRAGLDLDIYVDLIVSVSFDQGTGTRTAVFQAYANGSQDV
jgi:hypothetical protein